MAEQEQGGSVSIAEAARRLGISERTVYRRIKSGQIQRDKVSDKKVVKKVFCEEKVASIPVKVSDNIEIAQSPNFTSLHVELQARDAQIESLIANQREMNQTIQQLNQQIYELARLIFTSESEKNEKKSGLLKQWLGKWKPSSQKSQNHE